MSAPLVTVKLYAVVTRRLTRHNSELHGVRFSHIFFIHCCISERALSEFSRETTLAPVRNLNSHLRWSNWQSFYARLKGFYEKRTDLTLNGHSVCEIGMNFSSFCLMHSHYRWNINSDSCFTVSIRFSIF